MYPAPFKRSSPEGAERIPPIDGRALRKESWRLGSSPSIYETVNQSNYGNQRITNFDSKANKAAMYAMK